jgi:hypothetical protein
MRIVLITALFSVVLLCSSAATPAQAVVFVADIEGQWLLNNSQQIRSGQHLPSGGVVTNQSGKETDYIGIANLKGELVPGLGRSCKVAGQCSRPINLPRGRNTGILGLASIIVQGAMGVIYGDPEHVIIPRGRGIFSLPEGVVPLDGEQLDLHSIFRRREADRYYLGFIPKGNGAADKGLGPITLDWNPRKPSRVVVPGIAPGLYELTLLKAVDERYVRTDDSSWILITDKRNYRAANESFQQAKTLTKKWNRRVSPEARHSFLRASLSYLASTKSK